MNDRATFGPHNRLQARLPLSDAENVVGGHLPPLFQGGLTKLRDQGEPPSSFVHPPLSDCVPLLFCEEPYGREVPQQCLTDLVFRFFFVT